MTSEYLTSERILEIIIENHDDLAPDELAATILDAGFVMVGGRMAGDIIRWVAHEAECVIGGGDQAETVAFPPGTTGLKEAIEERDALYEEPCTWLRELAKKTEEGEL